MKKKTSVGAILAEILTELEAGQTPGAEMIKRGRSALKGVSKSLKAATAAAAASGNSGRKPKYDRAAIAEYLRANPEATVAHVADHFKCSTALVSIVRKESVEQK